ncbi:MAG: FmdB family zinc ribbon protein [Candidatus Bipolaricaulota bacterium]|nr:zinc ribbon domain-containing protein [Candidatus Bipolaricaulota bacterium]
MPLYKYRCNECDNVFKVLRMNGEEEDPECPECGSKSVERMVSSVGIRFKGKGFYRTDYKSNSNYKGNGGNGNGESSNSNGGESESDKVESKGE